MVLACAYSACEDVCKPRDLTLDLKLTCCAYMGARARAHTYTHRLEIQISEDVNDRR